MSNDAQAERRASLTPDIKACAGIGMAIGIGFGVVAPALPQIADQAGVGNAAVALGISGLALVRLASSIPVSRLSLRYGLRSVIVWGLLLQALMTVIAGLSPNFWVLITFRSLCGIGSAGVTIGAMALVIRQAAEEHRGYAVGFYNSGFMLGSIVGPGIGGFLADISPRVPFVFYGVLLLVAALIGRIFIADNAPATNTDDLADVLQDPTDEEPVVVDRPSESVFPPHIVRRTMIAVLVINFGGGWVFYGLRNSVIPLFATNTVGMTSATLGVILLVAAALQALLVGRVGRWSDRRGRRPVLIFATLCAAVALGLLCLPASMTLFCLSIGVLAIAGAGASSAPAAALADVTPDRDTRSVALFNMASDAGAIIGPVLSGVVADRVSYTAGFGLGVVTLLLGTIASLPMRSDRRPVPRAAASTLSS